MDNDVYVEIVRSRRKSIVIQVVAGDHVLIKAPNSMPQKAIDEIYSKNKEWIAKKIRQVREREQQKISISKTELESMYKKAMEVIPAKCKHYADIMGVSYNRITIKKQKTRWGSCSSKGNLNFNVLLMAMPDDVQDYVVIHELCHLREMNHSPAFWELVSTYMPSYGAKRRYLNTEGRKYID